MINPLRRLIEHSFPVFFRNQPFRNFDVIFIVGERPVGAEHELIIVADVASQIFRVLIYPLCSSRNSGMSKFDPLKAQRVGGDIFIFLDNGGASISTGCRSGT